MSSQTPTILLLGTCDTKLSELLYTKSAIEKQSSKVLLLDIGRNPTTHPEINITQEAILRTHPHNPNPNTNNKDKADNNNNNASQPPQPQINALPRTTYITALTPYLKTVIYNLYNDNAIHGILGIGGSCGTALSATLMRECLPIGFPKLLVSTMASGDVRPYIGETDISMMYSVVDIAGRNRVLERVLSNAAGAIAGMAGVYHCDTSLLNAESESESGEKRTTEKPRKSGLQIGITMFGVTTPAVTFAREHLETVLPGCEVYIFHATGSGGKAMERLIEEGQLDAVLDLTTTEIADEVVGGVLSAGEKRLSAATRRDIPRVVSVGACDMVNFGTEESVPSIFLAGDGGKKRVFHRHNPTVTLMRTTGEENRKIATLMARNLLGDSDGKDDGGGLGARRTKVLLPTGGISMLDVPGQGFWDPQVDEVLFSTLENELQGSGITVTRDARQINDPGFAVAAAEMLRELIEEH